MVRADHFAVLWAGDSRLYRLRDGALTQITTDHSQANSGHLVTRAVGAHKTLDLDLASDALVAGDRLLMCSDGVSDVVDDSALAQLLADGPIEHVAGAIEQASLSAGAPDNLSLIVVEAV